MASEDIQKLYDYYAFISYKRSDYKWAKWIRKKLISYKIPLRTYRMHDKKISRKCSPVFLDKMNLTPGLLDEGLKDEVQSSKYLIVLCSKDAHDNSKYLDEEISFFLEGGGRPSNIISLIVDKCENPVEQCFPLKLQEVYREHPEMMIKDATGHDKNRVFLELIAYMHGIDERELKKDEKLRICLSIASCLLMMIPLLLVFHYLWNFYVPMKHYYVDYTEKFGIPVGIGELSKKQIQGLSEHYTIISSRGLVRELRHENSYGRLISHKDSVFYDRPTDAVYTYADGRLDKVTIRDIYERNELVWEYKNDDLTIVDLINPDESFSGFSRAGFRQSGVSTNMGNIFMSGVSDSDTYAGNSNIVRYVISYYPEGYMKTIEYQSDWRHSYVASDSNGVSAILYKRDALGRISLINYFRYKGTGPRTDDDFFKEFTNTSLSNGVAAKKIVYDDNHRVKYITLAGLDNKPISSTAGYATVLYKYYDNGNMASMSFGDENFDLVTNHEGYHNFLKEYDEKGNVTVMRYFDTDHNLTTTQHGYAARAFEYDTYGNVIFEGFYDIDLNMTNLKSGYGYITYDYDKNQDRIRICYYDKDDNIVMVPQLGFAIMEREYENHEVLKEMVYDTNYKPVICAQGFAVRYVIRGDKDRIIIYQGTNGEPIINEQTGDTAIIQKFDSRGNLIIETSCDSELNPINNKLDYSTQCDCYDINGRVVYSIHYNSNGEACDPSMGIYFTELFEYDNNGNEALKYGLNTSGDIVYAKESKYEEGKLVQETDCLFEHNIAFDYGYFKSGNANYEKVYDLVTNASISFTYDEAGNVLANTNSGSDDDIAALQQNLQKYIQLFPENQ